MQAIDYNERTCLIIVEVERALGIVQMGVVVEAVTEVVHIKGADIEDASSISANQNTDYIMGMAKMQEGVEILIDIGQVLDLDQIADLDKAA